MNQITKIAALTGVVACVAGGVLWGAGYAAGGTDYVQKRDYSNAFDSGTREEKQLVMEKTRIDDATEIQADLKHLDLNVRPSNNDHWYIEYKVQQAKDGSNPLSYDVKDGVLELKEAKGAMGTSYIQIGFLGETTTDYDNEVTVYAPKDAELTAFSLEAGDGDLSVEGVKCKAVEWKLDYGDVTVKDCTLANGTVTAGDGSVTASEMNSEAVNWSLDYSDMTAKDCTLENETVTVSDGDVELRRVDCKSVDWKLDYGDLQTTDCTMTNSTARLDDGDANTWDSDWNNCSVTMHCGDVDAQGGVWSAMTVTADECEINASRMELRGVCTIDSGYGDVTFRQMVNDPAKMAVRLAAEYGEIDVSDKIGGSLISQDGSAEYQKKGGDVSLHITCSEGDITVR